MSPTDAAAPDAAAPDDAAPPVRVLVADHVLTVDDADLVFEHGAVAISGDRIVGAGPADVVLAEHPAAAVERLDGHLLMPGLVNAHTHLSMAMFRGVADDRDLGDFLGRLIPAENRLIDHGHVVTGTAAAAVESLCGGVTTALDMYYFPDAVLEAAERVGLRAVTGPVILDGEGPDGMAPPARIEWSRQWLADHPVRPGWRPVVAPHSTYLVAPELLQVVRELAEQHDAAVHVHAAETEAEVNDVLSSRGRRPVELLDHLDLLGPRTVVAHGVHLSDDEIERLRRTDSTVAHCPASNLKLASGIARVPDLLDAGAAVALGTDGPASSNDLDMFVAMRLAALLHKGVQVDPTVLPAAQVLRMATMDGARAVGLDADLGSIETGKLADLVALDLRRAHLQPVFDPVSTVVYAAGRGDVSHVWVGGEQVVAHGQPTRVDAAAVTDALAALRSAVLESAG